MDVKTLCLGVLARGPASGYEIRKEFESGPFSYFQAAGFGSIYPALARLMKDGLVSCTAMSQEKRPDKKVYRLTSSGRIALVDAIGTGPGDDSYRSDFLFVLFFAHLLTAPQVSELLSGRLEMHKTQLRDMEGRADKLAQCPPGERFVHDLGLAYHRFMVDFIETRGHELVGEILLAERKVAQS